MRQQSRMIANAIQMGIGKIISSLSLQAKQFIQKYRVKAIYHRSLKSAKAIQVDTIESGLNDNASMPSCINHLAKSI